MDTPKPKNPPKTELLFYDTLTSSTTKEKSFEVIDFSPPIQLHQIRIIRHSGTIHLGADADADPNQLKKSKTQTGPVHNFSVFIQEPKKPSYTLLCKETSFNEKSSNDYIIPISNKTQAICEQIILRGEYKSITVAIYGLKLEDEEKGSLSLEQPEFNVALSSSHRREVLLYFIEGMSMHTRMSRRDSLMASLPQEYNTMIRFDSIRPQLLLDDNDQDEDSQMSDQDSGNYKIKGKDIEDKIEMVIADLLKLSRTLNLEKAENLALAQADSDSEGGGEKSPKKMSMAEPCQESDNQSLPLYLQTINDTALMIKEYLESIKKNIFHPYMFEENRQENKKISQPIVAICLESLKGSHDSIFESYLGIKLICAILSLRDHASTFLEENGCKELFMYTLDSSLNPKPKSQRIIYP
jgi:hypothetical protein